MMSSALDFLDDKYICPHCHQEMTLCNAPPVHVGDGLGWGCEYLFICLNDECELFVNGWKYIENQYGHMGSYRYMRMPNSNESYNMMVGSRLAFTGSIVDPEQIRRQNERFCKEKEAIAKLDTCVEEHNLEPVLYLLLDPHPSLDIRKRAAELLKELNDLSCIDPLRNHDFKDTFLEQAVNMAISAILADHFMKECPFCAEIIKAQAKLCKHCRKELT